MRLYFFSCILGLMCFGFLKAQCPPNIGFEEGSFNHWQCYIGVIDTSGAINVVPATPSDGTHTLLTNNSQNYLDPIAGFPVNCPNGSGYSIKLGNEETGAKAEKSELYIHHSGRARRV